MPEEALQAAFEIKSACDEISRKLLRWHWEQKPGSHTLNALLDHLAQRQEESPEYYDRMPDLSGKTSWQQLDTTICMRVLLDPEKDASHPLDLLGDTPRPSAARRACNAVRTARNEAAHATDRTDCAQAAILFNEAIESLEEGYEGSALRTRELEQYYRMAEEFLSRCGSKKPLASSRKQEEDAASPRRSSSRSSERTRSQNRTGNRTSTTKRSTGGGKRKNDSNNRGARVKKRQRQKRISRTVVVLLLLVVLLGLIIRAFTMGTFA